MWMRGIEGSFEFLLPLNHLTLGLPAPRYLSASRQLEDPDSGSAPVRRILDLGDQRLPGGGNRAAVAHCNGHVLLARHRVADGRRVWHIVQALFPQHLAARSIPPAEHAIDGSVKDQAARGGQDAAGDGSALALGPNHFSGSE